MINNYHLTRKKASYHLVILHGHPWGGRFQMAGEGSAKVPAEMAGIPLANKLNILWLWKVFGDVIIIGSGQIVKVLKTDFLLLIIPIPAHLPASLRYGKSPPKLLPLVN